MTDHLIPTSGMVTHAAQISMGLLLLATVICLVRMYRGPGLSDRVVAMDFLTSIAVSFIGALAIFRQDARFIDVAMVLAVVAFLTTVSYARYIERITVKWRNEQNIYEVSDE